MNNARRSLLVFVLLPVLAGCASDRAYKYGPQLPPLQLEPKQNLGEASFKYDPREIGWTLLEDVEFDGQSFWPEHKEFLQSGESYVNGNTMRQRAKDLNLNLGQHHAEYILDNQDKVDLYPDEKKGEYTLVFPGTVWQDRYGSRYVPVLLWVLGSWQLRFFWLDGSWISNDYLIYPCRK